MSIHPIAARVVAPLTALRHRSVLLAVLVAIIVPESFSTSYAQQSGPALKAPAEQEFLTGKILKTRGYYEITPSGGFVFYPISRIAEAGVVHTIFAMMGPSSAVGVRGYYEVTETGEVRFFPPQGAVWPSFTAPRFPPGMTGMTGMPPAAAGPGMYGMPGMGMSGTWMPPQTGGAPPKSAESER